MFDMDISTLSDRQLIELFESQDLTIEPSENPKKSFGRRIYSEILSRYLGKRRDYDFSSHDLRTVSDFLRKHGASALEVGTDHTERMLVLPQSKNDLMFAMELPTFIAQRTFREPLRNEFLLRRVRSSQILFRREQYAIVSQRQETDGRSLFIPRTSDLQSIEFMSENSILFAGTFRSSSNISHFTYDTLPRIILAKSHANFEKVLLCNPFEIGKYQKFLLEYHNIRYFTIPEGFGVDVEDLTFFDNVSAAHGGLAHPANNCHPDFLGALTLGDFDGPGAPRIYVSRLDAAKRRPMVNERELCAALEGLGFTIVTPTEWKPEEQLSFFQKAEVIIGPHGAGLTSIFAAKRGTRFIEIFPPKATGAYAAVATALGLDYTPIFGEPVSGRPLSYKADIHAVLSTI